ncbi:DEAD/DEAH box helicase family protein [Mesorhizobium sp. M0999]|uniref:DEAD/DEAH box helicase n=1 Tax=Mesorhizobium sp. M0999 TaxID=2957045 RepID=UPI003339BC9C
MRIGGNSVVQHVFLGAIGKAEAFDSDVTGHDLMRTDLMPPFDEILMRRKGARRRPDKAGVVVGPESTDPGTWEKELSVQWDGPKQLASYCDTPEKVLASWVNQFEFREEDERVGLKGLRTPQIGALHAIAAHFAVGKEFDPATIVLPTGTGKTETMLAALVYRRFERTLVLVPSGALRTQIANKFATLGVLPDATVVRRELARPCVAVIEGGIRSLDDAQRILQTANVIVALPNALEASHPDAAAALVEGCSDLIVDEAHHVSADTWTTIRDRFKSKRILQFTATPFRRDGKRVDGKIIFNYKLGDAQEAGYYRPITLKTVEEYGDEDARDRTIAKTALEALRRDRDELGLDHLLMARTWKKDRAEAVFEIYRALAPELRPVLVYSGPGRLAANKDALASVLDRGPGGSRIVVCVDMLGEGFDLANLKIAALHDTHRSLAITLQFIGRFTRKGDWAKIGEATAIANIADPGVESKLAALYAEGADWDRLIRRFSEERIGSELRLQEVVLGLKETGDLAYELSLWNLRPSFSAQFFRTTCKDWSPLEFRSVLPESAESWFALNEAEKVLVAVVCRQADVKWGNYQNLNNTIYDLVILRWDQVEKCLCVYASDYKAMRSEAMALAVTDAQTRLVSGAPIFRILNDVELPLVKGLGSSRVGAISFTSYFGPNVTDGLADIEKREAELNNIACLGYEGGQRVLWGGTQKRGKIWQVKSGPISEWMDWTAHTWDKVTSEDGLATNITSEFLRPKRINGPHSSYPISVQWGEQAQMRLTDQQAVTFGGIEVPLFMVDLDISAIDEDGAIKIKLISDDVASEYKLTISEAMPNGYGHEHISGPLVQFRKSRKDTLALEEYLKTDPFIVRYADGTYSYNCYHIATNLNGGVFDKERLEAWNWDGIPLNHESMHKVRDQLTIQYRTFEHLRHEYDVIFNDDGHGESADLICLKDVDEGTIRLCLVHCKGAYGGKISRDIRNFYVVCGQAQKNITAKHKGLPRLYLDLKRRHDAWAKQGASRFLAGDVKQLAYFKEKARRAKLEFEVILVQPGASLRTVTEDSLRLLATTEIYLKKTTEASFRVVVSS